MTSPFTYILKGYRPVHEPDLLKWAAWFSKHDPHIALTKVKGGEVSTVFLGIATRRLLVFESMTFRRDKENLQRRYSTWNEAATGHKAMVEECGGATQQGRDSDKIRP